MYVSETSSTLYLPNLFSNTKIVKIYIKNINKKKENVSRKTNKKGPVNSEFQKKSKNK